jgi:hypothetical protein
MFLDPNTSTSLQTTLPSDRHLAEGQVLLEELTLNNAKSLAIPNRNSVTNNFQNRRAEFQTKVILSKNESIEAMPPHKKSLQF